MHTTIDPDTHTQAVAALQLAHDGRLRMPEARSLADVADYLGPWRTEPNPSHDGEPYYRGATDLGDDALLVQYATVDLSQLGGPRHHAIRLAPTDATRRALRSLVVPGQLSWKIIGHAHTGLALVLVQYANIIGSRWLAYVDPATIPTEPEPAPA